MQLLCIATMNFRIVATLSTSLWLLSAPILYAAAWTLPVSKYEVYTTTGYYSTDSYFDTNGTKQSQSRYSKYDVNVYAEMGWKEGTTLGTTLSLAQVTGTNMPRHISGKNYGISDPALFLRQRLWQGERMVFSVQPLLKLPSYFSNDVLPRSGTTQIDAELRLLAGSSFPLWGKEHFANLELAYRKRFDKPEDQLRMDATLGFSLSQNWQILPQLSVIHSLADLGSAAFTQTPQDDFHLLKPQLSVLYHYNDTLTFQAGGYSHLRGRNTGAGDGVLFSLWWRP